MLGLPTKCKTYLLPRMPKFSFYQRTQKFSFTQNTLRLHFIVLKMAHTVLQTQTQCKSSHHSLKRLDAPTTCWKRSDAGQISSRSVFACTVVWWPATLGLLVSRSPYRDLPTCVGGWWQATIVSEGAERQMERERSWEKKRDRERGRWEQRRKREMMREWREREEIKGEERERNNTIFLGGIEFLFCPLKTWVISLKIYVHFFLKNYLIKWPLYLVLH